MGTRLNEVLEQALALPEADRLELAETLFSSVEPTDGLPFDAEWLAEAQRRAARIDSGAGVSAGVGSRTRPHRQQPQEYGRAAGEQRACPLRRFS